jgi:hypothetical protein
VIAEISLRSAPDAWSMAGLADRFPASLLSALVGVVDGFNPVGSRKPRAGWWPAVLRHDQCGRYVVFVSRLL